MTGVEVEAKLPEALEPLQWSVRLWEQAPGKRWVVLVVAIACGTMGWSIFQSPLLALVGFLGIVGATSEFWLPLRYKLDSTRASVRCGISLTAIEWQAVKRIAESAVGVRLSPLEKQTRLAPFRGVFLRYAGNREQVLEYVNNLRGDSARILEPGTDG